jgi:hypothetical protein
MRKVAVGLVCLAMAAAAARADDLAACSTRRVELSKQAEDFTGSPRIKRLIQADLNRAGSEIPEGDADECMEALEHATNLLAGRY